MLSTLKLMLSFFPVLTPSLGFSSAMASVGGLLSCHLTKEGTRHTHPVLLILQTSVAGLERAFIVTAVSSWVGSPKLYRCEEKLASVPTLGKDEGPAGPVISWACSLEVGRTTSTLHYFGLFSPLVWLDFRSIIRHGFLDFHSLSEQVRGERQRKNEWVLHFLHNYESRIRV